MSVSHPDRLSYLLGGEEELGASYDEQADILYLWRGDAPVPAVSLTSEEGHLIRFDPKSYELVGITIFDFCRDWQQADPVSHIPVTIPSLGLKKGETTEPQRLELVPA
jgi:Protein of unknown function (DUF2283)